MPLLEPFSYIIDYEEVYEGTGLVISTLHPCEYIRGFIVQLHVLLNAKKSAIHTILEHPNFRKFLIILIPKQCYMVVQPQRFNKYSREK